MRSLLSSLSFFTFIPIPGLRHTPQLDGWALGWAPLVGWVIGGALLGLDTLLGLVFPHPLRAALLLAGWIVLTGATHLDGLADSLDALGASAPPTRRLQILRDVNTGSFALAGVTMVLIVKTAALSALPARAGWLLVTPIVARLAMLLVMRAYPYARKEGLGAGLRRQLTVGPLALATLTAAAGLWLAASSVAWVPLLVASGLGLAGGLLFAWWAWRRLRSGITGDIYGATVELTELIIILVAVGAQQAMPLP